MSDQGNVDAPLFDRTPMVLTVEEAARLLRISRSYAYELARRYRDSGGLEGIPVLSFGGSSLRVPYRALVPLVETGELVKLTSNASAGRRDH
jgi:excisionase family DNA binding protein